MTTKYPGSFQIPAMRYHNKLNDERVSEAIDSNEWCFQQKVDGAFYQLEKTNDGEIYLFGRSISKKTGELTEKIDNVPHIKEWAKNNLPNGTILLGEIFVNGGKSNNVTKIMGALPQKAYERQFKTDEFGGPLNYYIFDCIRYNKTLIIDEPFQKRVNTLYKLSMLNTSCIHFAKTYTHDNTFYQCDNFQKKISEIFEDGGEGIVFKRLDSIYEPEKRPMTCFKMKEHVDSVDLVITGLENPVMEYTGKELESWPYWATYKPLDAHKVLYREEDGGPAWEWIPIDEVGFKDEYIILSDTFKPVTKPYYYGWKNALRVGAYDENGDLKEIGRVASGLTDEIRADLAANPDLYIGSVCELSCMSLNKKDYTLRHPVFLGWRDDKDARDCIISEIFS